MKKMFSFAVYVMAAMAMALAMGSCKKEAAFASSGLSETNETQADSTLMRIMDFKGKVEYYRSHPDTKDGETLSVEDALWNIESLFNLTYAYPELAYNHTVVCDTVLYLAIDADGTVPLSRLTAFYDEMHKVVATLYHGLDIDNKQFLILDVEGGERQGGALAVGLHSVQGSVRGENPGLGEPIPYPGPFEDSISWYYGENGGNSLGQFLGEKDAADTLTGMLNARLVPVAPEGFEYYYTNTVLKQTTNSEQYLYPYGGFPNIDSRYCEFYKVDPSNGDYRLDSERMNFHYFAERYLVLSVFPTNTESPVVPSGHSLFQVIIEDYSGEVYSHRFIGHHTTALYGHREVIKHDIVVRGEL